MAKLTWEDVEDKLKQLGWELQGNQSNGNVYQIEISRFSPAGQDCTFMLQCEKDNPASVSAAFEDLYGNYDVDYETSLWIGPDGHGKDGAPHHIIDIVKDMESMEKSLKDSSDKMRHFVRTFEIEFTKEEVRAKFLSMVAHINGDENIEEKHAINLCKQAADVVINHDVGSPREKKALLNEYLKEIGINDNNPETYSNALNKALKEYQQERRLFKIRDDCENKLLGTVTGSMSTTEVRLHNMLDHLFNQSGTNPVDYAQFVLDASAPALAKGLKGEKFWEISVDHAVNSGGELWQDTSERINLMEKFGLIQNDYEDPSLYGPCYDTYEAYMKVYGTPGDTAGFIEFVEEIFPNKADMTEYLQSDPTLLREYKKFDAQKEDYLIEKYGDKADKMFSEYMHKYLKDLDVLDNKARDRKIAQHEKKRAASLGR